MKYLAMGLEPREEIGRIGQEERTRRIGHHQQRLQELLRARVRAGRTGLIFASVGLGPLHGGAGDVLTVKNEGGTHVRLDGPFPETKELLGGFDIIDFDSREEAIEYGSTVNVHPSNVEEIRPIREFWWISHSPRFSQANIFMFSAIENGCAIQSLSDAEQKKLIRAHQAVGTEYVTGRSMADGGSGLWVGARLSSPSEATTIRRETGKPRVIDGPFAETREVMGGFNLVACESIDEAARWAQKLAIQPGDAIEIRPVDGFWWIYHE